MLKRALLALAASLTIFLPAHAHSVRDLGLDEIIDVANVAFQGTVTENRSARDAQTGRIVTFTTFLVQDTLKGQPGQTYTIKQLGGELPEEGLVYKVTLQTKFTVGSSYVVFLHGKSNLGFASPVGTSQGRFTVVDDETGPAVTNGRDFSEMSGRMSDQAGAKATLAKAKGKRLGLQEFKDLVRSRAGALQ
jgi:hypothetical protein